MNFLEGLPFLQGAGTAGGVKVRLTTDADVDYLHLHLQVSYLPGGIHVLTMQSTIYYLYLPDTTCR